MPAKAPCHVARVLSGRLQVLSFIVVFLSFAWFHQGGGWNQNARFAEVRAIVEQGTFAIDDFLVYRRDPKRPDSPVLLRANVEKGEFRFDGKRHQLSWGTATPDIAPTTVNGTPPAADAVLVKVGDGTATGDCGYSAAGHFHSNKPPGTSLLAVPVYYLLHHCEKLAGWHPDDWRVMTFNAWMATVFTTGLASALGVVLFLRVGAAMFSGRQPAVMCAAAVLAFGTTYFPFATVFFDHNITAVLLLAAFAAARNDHAMKAGLWCGAAALTNYLAGVPGAMFGWYLLRKNGGWDRRSAVHFTLGVLPCFIGLLAVNTLALGSPFTLSTTMQNPAFKQDGAFLGMFVAPSWFSAAVITLTPWRGLFWLCPALLLVPAVMWFWWRARVLRAERWLFAGITLFFIGVNTCFNGYHAGNSAGPRYLIPLLPFLCLPLVPAFVRWPAWTALLGLLGVFQNSLLTITDAQNPLGVSSHAWVDRPGEYKDKLYGGYNLVSDYALPLFVQDQARPIVDRKFEQHIAGIAAKLEQEIAAPAARAAKLREARAAAWARVEKGEPDPLLLAAMPGPVSVNVQGTAEGTYFHHWPAHSPPARFSSFNAGEWFFPESRWSVAPLAVLWLAGLALARRWCQGEDVDEYAVMGYKNSK